ncbi:hypothetical protein [uncultured Pseudophaeobacter sp.]|jgi:hypothetical protein|uniref:hypothetical protein n=1 Tax=uncultured Pseudophaeobacter sp. TaxID=1759421 RepID=UPI0025F764AF|nr:hypothetical protein [uncultured Pseudophaeobacter sp.]
MNIQANHLQPVDACELPVYPIEAGERLESHYFVEFHYQRWLTSDTRLLADLEVRSVFLDLICLAQTQSPVGTLPTNPKLLAKLVGLSQEVFDGLCKREVGPLHNWAPCLCDGVQRLHHPVVTEIALKAVNSKKRNAAANANDRERKRFASIRKILVRDIPGGARFAESQSMVEQISGWIEGEYPGGSCTVTRVKEALNALSARE